MREESSGLNDATSKCDVSSFACLQIQWNFDQLRVELDSMMIDLIN